MYNEKTYKGVLLDDVIFFVIRIESIAFQCEHLSFVNFTSSMTPEDIVIWKPNALDLDGKFTPLNGLLSLDIPKKGLKSHLMKPVLPGCFL